MILEQVYETAKKTLDGKTICDVRVGLGLMAVEIDNDLVGVTYVLRNEIGHSCGLLPQAGSLLGMKATEVAQWAIDGKNPLRNAMGLAVLNAAADFENLQQIHPSQDADAVFSIEIRESDSIGIIGHIGPVINRLSNKNNPLFIFERDAAKETPGVYPESAQPDLLPKCQVIFVTSSTLINGTLESLLPHCSNAREIVMVGSSTPLYPEAFRNSGVTVLSGTRWLPSEKNAILAGISQCAGIKQLMPYGQKISTRVPDR